MFKEIIKTLNEAKCVGIFTHINPDGDALGSSYSLKKVLTDMGKKAEVYLDGSIEPSVMTLTGASLEPLFDVEVCDMLIALDSADIDRLGKYANAFSIHKNTAAIDHHKTHNKFAKMTAVKDVSSTCELMYELYSDMGIAINADVATNLYIGIATDTGNFKYSSVTGDTHRIAGMLIDKGVLFADITKKLFDTVSKEYLKLQSRAISKLKFYCSGKIAVLNLTNTDFEECGIDEATASAIVTLPSRIEGVEVGVYIRNRGDNECKVSLRSVNIVDVANIATKFGGGGHTRAAGYSITADEVEDNINNLIKEAEAQM